MKNFIYLAIVTFAFSSLKAETACSSTENVKAEEVSSTLLADQNNKKKFVKDVKDKLKNVKENAENEIEEIREAAEEVFA